MEIDERYSRTVRIIGEDGVSKLAASKVAVFGLGGVGSSCVEALARAGIGHFLVVDKDVVEPSNINRQVIAFMSTIGQNKVDVMEAMVLDINPYAKVEKFKVFVRKDNIGEIFQSNLEDAYIEGAQADAANADEANANDADETGETGETGETDTKPVCANPGEAERRAFIRLASGESTPAEPASVKPKCIDSGKAELASINLTPMKPASIKPDYIVDALDTLTAKTSLALYAQSHGIPIISSMGGANKTDPTQLGFADLSETKICPLCREMRKIARKEGISNLQVLYSTEKPVAVAADPTAERSEKTELGTMPYFPPIMGQMIASYVIRELIGWAIGK